MNPASSNSLVAAAKLAAQRYGLYPPLVCAVCEQESGWNAWAIRYEPLFFDKYIQPLLNQGTIHNMTEAQARAMSWGLMQVMGQTARAMGFAGHLASLCDPDIGLAWGCQKLKECLEQEAGNMPRALQRYNGGGDPNYALDVLDKSKKYL